MADLVLTACEASSLSHPNYKHSLPTHLPAFPSLAPLTLSIISLSSGMAVTKSVSVIAAACRSNGIGNKGSLPWRLKQEMEFFTRITSQTEDGEKKNAVVMGRKTWESIPAKYRPLEKRVNVILSASLDRVPVGADLLFSSLDSCLLSLQANHAIERIFVIGGQQVYADAINSLLCQRIYLTRIDADFECDTFFPAFDTDVYAEVTDASVPSDVQQENGIKYRFHVYDRLPSSA